MNPLGSFAVILGIAGIGLMLSDGFFDLGLVLLIESGVLATLLLDNRNTAPGPRPRRDPG